MKVKYLGIVTMACLLFGTSQVMAVDATATTKSPSHGLLVLVQVNDQGDVTNVDPATDLRPDMEKNLRKTLDKMITKPAHDKNGKPISSQFVINLAIHAKKLANGSYQTSFVYVSAKPVPPGAWHWRREHGQKMVLVSQNNMNSMRSRQKQINHAAQDRRIQSRIRAMSSDSTGR